MSVQSHPFEIVDLLDIVHAAVAVVARRLPAHVDRDDLRAAGYLALVQHYERAPVSESEARAFLMRRVAGALRDELRRADALGRKTRWIVTSAKRIESRIEAVTGAKPDLQTVALELGVSNSRLQAALAAEERANTAFAGEAINLIASEEPTPLAIAESHEDAASVLRHLEVLTPKERFIVEKTILEDATLEEAAFELGITKGRAHQLRKAAIARLRTVMA